MNKTIVTSITLLLAFNASAFAQNRASQFTTVASLGQDSLDNPVESPSGRFILLNAQSGGLVVFDRTTKQLRPLNIQGNQQVWSRQGNRIAFVHRDENSPLTIWSVAVDPHTAQPLGPAQRVSLTHGAFPSFSPDGRSLVFTSGQSDSGTVVVVPATGGDERIVAKLPGETFQPLYTPDGKWIYFNAAATHGAARVPANGGKVEPVPVLAMVSMSPDGKYLASTPDGSAWINEGAPVVITTLDGKEVARVPLPTWSYDPHFSMADDRLHFVTLDVPMAIHAVDLPSGQPRALTKFSNYDRSPVYSPSGDRIAVQRLMNGRFGIAVLDRNGRTARNIRTAREASSRAGLAWSPDGRKILYVSTVPPELHMVDIATGSDARIVAFEGVPLRYGKDPAYNYRWTRAGNVRYIETVGPNHDIFSGWGYPNAVMEYVPGRGSRVVAKLGSGFEGKWAAFFNDTTLTAATRTQLDLVDLKTMRSDSLIAFPNRNRFVPATTQSRDGKWLAYQMVSENPNRARYALISLAGQQKHDLEIPAFCGSGQPQWHPDGEHLVVYIWNDCNTEHGDLYWVSANSDAPPRKLTASDNSYVDLDHFDISPDGKTVAYDVEQAWNRKLMELDLKKLLQTSAQRVNGPTHTAR